MDVLTKSLGNPYSIYLKYTIIIISFLITLLIGSNGYNRRDTILLQLSKLFTLIADYYLLIQDNFPLGIFFFCIVQITYILRHSYMEKKRYRNLIFLCTSIIFSILIFFRVKLEPLDNNLVFLALIYAALLVTSVYVALSTLKRSKYSKKSSYLIGIGMCLFFLCDINVGLNALIGETTLNNMITPKIKFLIGYLIWLFYAPSQVLLACSGFKSKGSQT
ncbi:lysoplasmalogenase family protein [Clostridium sp. BL8]|nr:lysoplasmalogenase family protein [Clostridium sp. BL8]